MEAPDELFESHRPRLLGLAYRMVGGWGEAEDLVQEAWLRWYDRRGSVDDDAAWLTTVTSRLCLDHLRSARVRREEYVGTWLPEPIPTDTESVDGAALRADGLSYALLALLESLTPPERVAFVLREAFDADYSEVGRVLDRTEPACRQLVSRARRKLRRTTTTDRPDAEAIRTRLMESFERAVAGDLGPLLGVLAPDAVLHSDGGGKVLAALKPIYGADKISRFFAGVLSKAPPGLRLEPRELNGEPALVVYARDEVLQTFHLELKGDVVRSLYVVRNPDKLTRVSDARETGR